MDVRKITLGLGGFALGTVTLVAAAVLGDRYARGRASATPDEGAAGEGDTASAPVATGQPAATAAPQAQIAPPASPAPAAPATPSVGNAEHVPTDLMGDHHPGPNDRAPDAFRPDPTAPVPESEREGLRPATGPAPTLVSGRSDDRI